MDNASYEPAGPLVAVAASTEVMRHPEAGEHLLGPAEQQRAARFHQVSGRLDYVAAHVLVRICAARVLGVDASGLTLAQQCPDCGDPTHGKPYLPGHPDLHVSLSHTRGVVAAAAGYHPVGVDVELPTRTGTPVEVFERVLTEAEMRLVQAHPEPGRAFLRQWVRKEAMVKIGRTTLDTLGGLDLSALPLDTPGERPLRSRFTDLYLLDWQDGGQDGDGRGTGATACAVSTRAPRLATLATLAP
ncbi:4'-phosphopantetheinyl transferase family protein [Kitasatospora herbaricolor]|uniref:4'-phosphopantetheinyl transferase superfamily protein n=1 Tax=Kitasatospora herbaricolor TaxID=68217 RepID=A0ABZ1WDU0_9ACTN|nr:4'-phosphopantetheinyl transferase superfamily protein [Kitasatospora herbaricolor]